MVSLSSLYLFVFTEDGSAQGTKPIRDQGPRQVLVKIPMMSATNELETKKMFLYHHLQT